MAGITKEEQKRRAELLSKGLKVCNKCHKVLPLEQFGKCKTNKDGLQYKCKECDKQQTKQYYQEHKEERLQYQNQYHQEHKEKILQYHKQYNQENKEEIQQYKQQHYQEHKEKILQYNQQRNEAIKNGTHKVIPRKTHEQFIQELYEVNPDIEVLENYQGSMIKIECKCKLDGYIWEATPNSLLLGHGCPKCDITKGEKRVAQYLDNLDINYIYNKGYFNDLVGTGGGLLKPDFIIPTLKIWIEYDGIQHFEPIDFTGKMSEEQIQEQFKIVQQNDQIKNQYAKDNNWTLIRIPYWDIDNIEQILDSYLKQEQAI